MNNYQAQQFWNDVNSIIGFTSSILVMGFMVGIVRSIAKPLGNPDTKALPPIQEAKGTCYRDAWRYVMHNIEGVLVHGTIVGLRGRMSHAWVELPDGTVWDPSSQVKMPMEKYYSLVDPIVEYRYTADEAAHMLSVGKHGPWSDEERARWLFERVSSRGDFVEVSTKLAQDQRGAPEHAMLRIQHSQIAQLYGFVAEHTGDITNRMAEDVVFFKGNFGAVEEKVRKTLRVLRDRYGFEREFKKQINANLPFIRKTRPAETFDTALTRLKQLGQSYAEEHKKLIVANEAQKLARDAAIAIGEFRFKDAVKNLEILEAELVKGREAWDTFALQGY